MSLIADLKDVFEKHGVNCHYDPLGHESLTLKGGGGGDCLGEVVLGTSSIRHVLDIGTTYDMTSTLIYIDYKPAAS